MCVSMCSEIACTSRPSTPRYTRYFALFVLGLVLLAQISTTSAAVMKWVRQTGGYVGPIDVGAPRTSFSPNISFARPGLFATAPIKANDVILEIPMRSILTLDAPYAEADSPCSILIDVLRENNVTDPYSLLAIRLLHEQVHAKNSEWAQLLSGYAEPASVCLFDQKALDDLHITGKSPIFIARDQHLQLSNGIRTVIEQTMTSLAQASAAIAESAKKAAAENAGAAVDGDADAVSALVASSSSFADKLFPKGTLTQESYLKAYVTVLNHAIEIPAVQSAEAHTISDWIKTVLESATSPSDASSSADDSILALAPVLQFINHANPELSNTYLTTVFPVAAGLAPLAIRLRATRDIAAGEELTISYGSFYQYHRILARAKAAKKSPEIAEKLKASLNEPTTFENHDAREVRLEPAPLSNTQLLLQHGISLPVNTAEAIALEAGIDNNNPTPTPGPNGERLGPETPELTNMRKELIRRNHLNTTALLTMTDGPSSPEHGSFLQALRTKHLSERDMKRLLESNIEFHPRFGYFSLQNELRVFLGLASSLEELLLSYPTMLKDDKQDWLNEAKAFLAQRNALCAKAEDRAACVAARVPPARLSALAHRQALKRVLHTLVLDSLHSVRNLFASLRERWSQMIRDELAHPEVVSPDTAGLSEQEQKDLAEWRQQLQAWEAELSKWDGEVKVWDEKFIKWNSSVYGGDIGGDISL